MSIVPFISVVLKEESAAIREGVPGGHQQKGE